MLQQRRSVPGTVRMNSRRCAGFGMRFALSRSRRQKPFHSLNSKVIRPMLISIIGWIIFGLIIGALARLLVPGRQDMGLLKTTLLGIAGSFVGGFLGSLLFGGDAGFQAAGWIGSLLGAVLVLVIAIRLGRASA